jgi:hypothetical protein
MGCDKHTIIEVVIPEIETWALVGDYGYVNFFATVKPAIPITVQLRELITNRKLHEETKDDGFAAVLVSFKSKRGAVFEFVASAMNAKPDTLFLEVRPK